MSDRTVIAENWGWRHAGRRAWAIRHLDFRLEAGERVLLLGAYGAGKSTLLAALAGVLTGGNEGESEGSLLMGGQPPQARRGHSALVLQDPQSQIVLARVGDDVAFGCENMAMPPDRIWPTVSSSLTAVGLDLQLDHPTGHLSGGQQQRLVLAGALAMGAELLLLDEPTANLDPAGADQVRDAVAAAVADRRRGLVVVEHHCEVWADMVDRVLVLSPAGTVADGPPHQVFNQLGRQLADMGVWVPQKHLVAGRGQRGLASHAETRHEVDQPGENRLDRQDPAKGGQGPNRGVDQRDEKRPPRQDPPTNGPVALPDPIITCTDLAVGYGKEAVCDGITIAIPRGQSTVITGANGSGKTTLALTLAGLLPPVSGLVETQAPFAPLRRPQPHTWTSKQLLTRIGAVFQSPDHQFVASTVFDEIAVGLRALKRDRATIDATVTDLLERLGLAKLAKANPFTLSGGEKRRLSVATVLACEPSVIVLDEPTFGQDRSTWLALVALIADLRDRGATIVSVTHDSGYITRLGDHRIDLGEHR
ncbi:MAG: energy-coupling factor ABC transporter ATP-binding protein [Propionibacteriaceae bacterium]|jgi:energy-coupling factor transport system ATP-binding protein|nr:energy-coupling factor ABC transporter ATP-binding protein [Propionibacteriaceae bacterium]